MLIEKPWPSGIIGLRFAWATAGTPRVWSGGVLVAIISHARKFIFVKTHKTAGTSLEMALSRHCGQSDVITPFGAEDERLRREVGGIGPQNFYRPLSEYPPLKRLKLIARRRREYKFGEHHPAWLIRRTVGEEIWNSYFKFAVVRNPYDRCVSKYFFTRSYFDELKVADFWDRSFDQYLRYFAESINENWVMYTDKDQIILDFIVRYEHLEEDLAEVSNRIGLPRNLYEDMKHIRAKGAFRPQRTRGSEALNETHRRLVSILCRKEIEAFGYDGGAAAPQPAGVARA